MVHSLLRKKSEAWRVSGKKDKNHWAVTTRITELVWVRDLQNGVLEGKTGTAR